MASSAANRIAKSFETKGMTILCWSIIRAPLFCYVGRSTIPAASLGIRDSRWSMRGLDYMHTTVNDYRFTALKFRTLVQREIAKTPRSAGAAVLLFFSGDS